MKNLLIFLNSIKEKQIFRYNLVIQFLIWIVVGFILISPIFKPLFFVHAVSYFLTLMSMAWLFLLSHSIYSIHILSQKEKQRKQSIREKYLRDKIKITNLPVQHLIFVCLYKEPLDLIESTMDSLAKQTMSNNLNVVLAFESRTPHLEDKIEAIRTKYINVFNRLIFTVHPHGVKGEIPGKCSNVNFSIREVVRRFKLEESSDMDSIIVTTCDADNSFHPIHFEELGRAFLNEHERYQCVWQAPLFYDWQPQSSSFIARVTGTMRSVNMMGFLIPLNINTMSIQSLSLKLLIRGDYFTPLYQMEDILFVVRLMTEVRQRVKIRMLPIPLLSGPTSGENIWEEFAEWYLQLRRWTIGAAEVFHYFMVRFFNIPFSSSMQWGLSFVFYYYLFQLLTPIVLILTSIMLHVHPQLGLLTIGGISFSRLFLILSMFQLISLLVMNLLQVIWTRGMRIGEALDPFHKLIDTCLTPFVMVAYSFAATFAIHELSIRGREVCGHNPSSKESLKRTSQRVDLRVIIGIQVDTGFYKGEAENIGEGGIFVTTENLLPINSDLKIQLYLPELNQEFYLPVQVRWHRKGLPSGMGLKFKKLSIEEQNAIENYIRTHGGITSFYPI